MTVTFVKYNINIHLMFINQYYNIIRRCHVGVIVITDIKYEGEILTSLSRGYDTSVTGDQLT